MEGKCEHGTFDLEAGCPQCIAERQQIPSGGLAEAAQKAGAEVTVSDVHTTPIQATALINCEPLMDAEAVALFNEAILLKQYADARVIESLSDLKSATADLNIIRKLKRTLEALRKEWLKPLQDATKGINADFATLMAPVNDADKITAGKMLDFDNEQKRIRAEQEEVNRLRIEAAEKEAALNDGVITESVDLIKVSEVLDFVRTDAGNAGMRDNWKWEVTDFSLVPDEYKKVDEGTLTRVVKASKGKVPIPGVRVYNEPIIAVRG